MRLQFCQTELKHITKQRERNEQASLSLSWTNNHGRQTVKGLDVFHFSVTKFRSYWGFFSLDLSTSRIDNKEVTVQRRISVFLLFFNSFFHFLILHFHLWYCVSLVMTCLLPLVHWQVSWDGREKQFIWLFGCCCFLSFCRKACMCCLNTHPLSINTGICLVNSVFTVYMHKCSCAHSWSRLVLTWGEAGDLSTERFVYLQTCDSLVLQTRSPTLIWKSRLSANT